MGVPSRSSQLGVGSIRPAGGTPLVGALGLSALMLVALSVGPVRWGPYRALAHLPLFDSLVPSRLALAVLFIAGVLVARAGDEVAGAAGRATRRPGTTWTLWYAAVIVALLPIAPVPLPTVRPQPVPAFITEGTWRRYVDDRHSLVTVPPTTNDVPNGMRLAAAAHLGFRLANGYFLGPAGKDDPRAGYTPRPRFLTRLLTQVRDTGTVPALTDTDRHQRSKTCATGGPPRWYCHPATTNKPCAGPLICYSAPASGSTERGSGTSDHSSRSVAPRGWK